MPNYPQTPPRLGLVFAVHPLYFVTFCTHQRRPLLANERAHSAFVEFARAARANSDIAVGRYVIMPDHLHLFVCGGLDFKLGAWVGSLKRILRKCADPHSHYPQFWQRGFFDHVLRSSESYSEKWNYVFENPVRAGLAQSLEDWPYSGEIVDIYFD
jgi:putative transposase